MAAKVLAAGVLAVAVAAAPAAAKVRAPVAAHEIKVSLGCAFSTVRDHRVTPVRITTFQVITNTTSATLPIGTPIHYTTKKVGSPPFETYVPLYIKLDPAGKYELRVGDDTDTNFQCAAWIIQQLSKSAAP